MAAAEGGGGAVPERRLPSLTAGRWGRGGCRGRAQPRAGGGGAASPPGGGGSFPLPQTHTGSIVRRRLPPLLAARVVPPIAAPLSRSPPLPLPSFPHAPLPPPQPPPPRPAPRSRPPPPSRRVPATRGERWYRPSRAPRPGNGTVPDSLRRRDRLLLPVPGSGLARPPGPPLPSEGAGTAPLPPPPHSAVPPHALPSRLRPHGGSSRALKGTARSPPRLRAAPPRPPAGRAPSLSIAPPPPAVTPPLRPF